MSFVSRIVYAGRITGLVIILVLIVGAIFAPQILRDYVAGVYFVVAVFILAFLVAPTLRRRFPRL